MAFRRSNTMYDAMISGINGLGETAQNIAKTQSDLKLRASQLKESEQNQQIGAQTIAKNNESAAQALGRKQLMGSLEDAGSLSPGAMTGKGPQNAVNMDEIQAAKKFDSEAKLWNSLNMDKDGFTPLTGKQLKDMAEAKGQAANKADQQGVLAAELQTNLNKDPALSPTEKAFYGTKPEAYGERLKPVGVTYLPGEGGYVGVPSKLGPGGTTAPPVPVMAGGAPVKPISKEPTATKWVDKVDDQGNTYQVNPVTGETRDTGRKAAVKAGKIAATPADLVSKAEQGINLIDQMIGNDEAKTKPHPGFQDAVGVKGLSSLFGAAKKPAAGSAAADFMALYDQVTGQAFLEARQDLKGAGAITDVEGLKAQSAITRMNTSQSEAAFKSAAKEFRDIMVRARDKAKTLKAAPAAAAALSDDDIIGAN